MSGNRKLAIIYPDKSGWAVDQFRESAEKRNISVKLVEVTDNLLADEEVDKQVADADAVLWKFANATLAGFLASYPILKDKTFINTGVVLMPSATDKFLQQQLMLRSDLRQYAITTYRVQDAAQVDSLVEEGALSYPLIIKPAWGTNARGVHIIHSKADIAKVTSWQSQIAEPFILSNEEWRVFVIGGSVAGIMKKQRRDGANLHRTIIGGGARNSAEIDSDVTEILSDIAEKTAALFHLEYAGVDIVRDRQTGLFSVYEANSAAGWQNGFAEATGEDIPGQVIDWFMERIDLRDADDLSAVIKKYLMRRSHRLPLIDELLLLSELIVAGPEPGIMERRQQLMGANYGELRRVISSELTASPTEGRMKVQDLLTSIKRHHTIEVRTILGDELFEAVYREDDKKIAAGDGGLVSLVRQLMVDPDVLSIQDIDNIIAPQFAQVPLDILLDFAVAARRTGGQSRFEDVIINRAETSVSWAGNFLIDEVKYSVGVSTRHTMRQGYMQSVRYVQLMAIVNRQGL